MLTGTFNPSELLQSMFRAAIAAAVPEYCMAGHLPPDGGRLRVVGAGKAAAAMAKVVEDRWHGDLAGLVVAPCGARRSDGRIEIMEAAHPVPDVGSVRAAQRILDFAAGLDPRDQVLCLLSGGASRRSCACRRRSSISPKSRTSSERFALRRNHSRNELRAAASFRDQGRAARGRLLPGAASSR